jgi:alpha-D-ribose 1-methylphosphonate 5-triphosphate diphosphatase
VASHDDTTDAHSVESARDGITISEFPTTLSAARKAKEFGMHVIMGAPNLVRGNSHSGNVSAAELAEKNLLDGLSSDYYPSSLLHASFLLHQQYHMPLPSAVAKVSANISDLLNLKDRGEIAPGKRADLIRVKMCGKLPVVRAIWKSGKKVF